MEESRQAWVPAAAFLGIAYALVGVLFALPATHLHAWRRGPSVLWDMRRTFGYEHFRLKSSPRFGALHVALAVALGAFGLAVAANIHSLSSGPGALHRQLLLLSLGVWPAMTALPAFLVALAISALLARASSSEHAG